jgi:anti-sigma factor RsiW
VRGHLGSRVSALLDGQLPPEDAERAWEHVHSCHQCRDLVEREGWVKTRLAGLSFGDASAPDHLKGSLLGRSHRWPPGDAYLHHTGGRSRRNTGLVALGGGAVGAAVMGVLALGAAPADAPTNDRRAPVTNLVRPSETPRTTAPSPATSLRPSVSPGRAQRPR